MSTGILRWCNQKNELMTLRKSFSKHLRNVLETLFSGYGAKLYMIQWKMLALGGQCSRARSYLTHQLWEPFHLSRSVKLVTHKLKADLLIFCVSANSQTVHKSMWRFICICFGLQVSRVFRLTHFRRLPRVDANGIQLNSYCIKQISLGLGPNAASSFSAPETLQDIS